MAVNKLFTPSPSFISNADYSTHTVTKGYKDWKQLKTVTRLIYFFTFFEIFLKLIFLKARCGLSLMYSISVNYFRLLNFYLPVVYLLHSHTSHTQSYAHTTFPPPPSNSHSHLTAQPPFTYWKTVRVLELLSDRPHRVFTNWKTIILGQTSLW